MLQFTKCYMHLRNPVNVPSKEVANLPVRVSSLFCSFSFVKTILLDNCFWCNRSFFRLSLAFAYFWPFRCSGLYCVLAGAGLAFLFPSKELFMGAYILGVAITWGVSPLLEVVVHEASWSCLFQARCYLVATRTTVESGIGAFSNLNISLFQS